MRQGKGRQPAQAGDQRYKQKIEGGMEQNKQPAKCMETEKIAGIYPSKPLESRI
jgi:hypothetical protein